MSEAKLVTQGWIGEQSEHLNKGERRFVSTYVIKHFERIQKQKLNLYLNHKVLVYISSSDVGTDA